MHRYCRISLRVLVLIAPLIVGLGLVQIAGPIRKARELENWNAATRRSTKEIEAAHGTVEVFSILENVGWSYRSERSSIIGVHFTSITDPKWRPFPRSEALYEALRLIPSHHALSVSHTDFCRQDLERLEGANFTGLSADFTLLSDNGLSGTCPENLRIVYVKNTAVGDAFVQWASWYGNIRFFDLSGTQITDACVPDLLKNSWLYELNVQDTQLSESAIKTLEDSGKIRRLKH